MAMVLSAAMMCRYGLDLPGVSVPYFWTLVHTKLAKCGISRSFSAPRSADCSLCNAWIGCGAPGECCHSSARCGIPNKGLDV